MPRPIHDFHGMIGQKRLRTYLVQQIAGAKVRGHPCPSVTLVGPAGVGKTSIARAIGSAFGTRVHELHGRDLTAEQLLRVLQAANHADVVFIDEAHGLSPAVQDALLLLLDESKLPNKAEGGTESVADVTLLLATNRPGELSLALRSRAPCHELEEYSPSELTEIARRVATELGITLTGQAARRLAEGSQGSPRTVNQLVEGARRHHAHADEITQPMVERFLEVASIAADGMTMAQRRYLATLARSARGSSSLERLVARLGVDPGYLRDTIEPWLLAREFIAISSGGRSITPSGRERLNGVGEAPSEPVE